MTMVRVEDLVGAAEACHVLGLTQARMGQLRAQGRFPEPIHRVAATPLWQIPTLLEWERTWVRLKPGRPKKVRDA